MSHKVHDAVGLALAQRIAAGLDSHPEWLELAKANLRQWSAHNAQSPRLLTCYDEWIAILNRPMEEVRRHLLDDSDDGQRRRQNSPFVGILTPAEIRQIKQEARAATAT